MGAATLDRFGRIDFLVNNAAIYAGRAYKSWLDIGVVVRSSPAIWLAPRLFASVDSDSISNQTIDVDGGWVAHWAHG